MLTIRCLRARKYQNKSLGLIISIKLFTLCYIGIFLFSYLTFNTGAFYNDTSKVVGTFEVGTWETPPDKWDKSSLAFQDQDRTINMTSVDSISCKPLEIGALIKNNGADMNGPSEYEVYFSANQNPMKGQKVSSGVINPLISNHSEVLKFIAANPGNYKFRAFQRPGHGNKSDRQDLWSETITLTCDNKAIDSSADVEKEKVEDSTPPEGENTQDKTVQPEEEKVNTDAVNEQTDTSNTQLTDQPNENNEETGTEIVPSNDTISP
ncbi:YqxM protein [Bacillus sp. cl95]|uniref:amyloid fiber anchoring/assembly protein TapA n=1 Tax=Bacillus sp. UNCCL13 TaxID=1502772 RepID=UPI0008EC83D4|nr:amyloid fiber anchoring/assembly protein TapA [Bacillus sp. UNCCL13]SFB13440.1 YqxM protein [Bacillus sp. UNCCL13]SFQ90015.1 YqxM protein [Bacillus sp. cl95]